MLARSLVILGLVALGASAQAVPVSIVASDDFDSCSVGTLSGANGGSGWAGAWAGSTGASVVATNAADAPMIGQAARFSQPISNAAATRRIGQTVDQDAVFIDSLGL
jgi:hypothetical protein